MPAPSRVRYRAAARRGTHQTAEIMGVEPSYLSQLTASNTQTPYPHMRSQQHLAPLCASLHCSFKLNDAAPNHVASPGGGPCGVQPRGCTCRQVRAHSQQHATCSAGLLAGLVPQRLPPLQRARRARPCLLASAASNSPPRMLSCALTAMLCLPSPCLVARRSFAGRIRHLRREAGMEAEHARTLIESLDTIDDVELQQLRLPKRALRQAPVYGGVGYGGQPGVYPGLSSPAQLPQDTPSPVQNPIPSPQPVADATPTPSPVAVARLELSAPRLASASWVAMMSCMAAVVLAAML